MNQSYSKRLTVSLAAVLIMMCHYNANAQCPYGVSAGSTFYDTTISTPTGINSLQIKFPQADPLKGMVTCVKLCITITGVVDSVSIENNSASPQTADAYYIRTDQITGPGLITPLINTINFHYGSYALGPTNGVFGSGPDFIAISKDTIQNAKKVCGNISDSAALSQFYGHDSVTYTYNITAFTNVSCTGGNYNSTVATSAFVNFHFEYCTCPGYILPLNIKQFFANKIADNKAELKWAGFDNPNANYHYEAQVSRDGHTFTTIGTVAKHTSDNDDDYKLLYTTNQNESGAFYFRIKQAYSNGYSQYSSIRQVNLQSSVFPKFSVYPNPSSGIVGIKFDNISGGEMLLQIFNAQGQSVAKKEIVATAGSSYWQVTSLQSGVYWLRMTDMNTKISSVNQLFIK